MMNKLLVVLALALLVPTCMNNIQPTHAAKAAEPPASLLMTASECMSTCFPLKVRTFDPRATFGACVCGECSK